MIIMLDFETTGLPDAKKPLGPGITQIGAIKLDAGFNEIDSYQQDVNPELHIDDWQQGAINLRGIGPEDLVEAPTFFAAFWKLAEFVRGSIILSGHNLNSFDSKVLETNLKRYGFERHFPWPTHHIDTMDLCKKEYGKRRKNGDVYRELTGKKIDGAHDALPDARATCVILKTFGAEQVRQILEYRS